MRLYGKRFLGKKVQRQVSERKETRDAIVWDILPLQKVARVRIQGSSTNIIAHYPTSWETAPSWLKPGNVVRINFVGGNRQRVEVIGTGKLRPTPTDGSAATPDASVFDDAVLTGGLVYPIPLNNRMAVMVKTGTYRINGTAYALDAVAMDEGDDMIMGDGCPLGETAAIVNIDTPASGYYRIDYIVVGTDGTVDCVKGTEATSNPQAPTLPADHVLLNQVFVYPGITEITYNEIGQSYAEPIMSTLKVEISDAELSWTESSTAIFVTPLDQYGNAIGVEGDNIVCGMQMLYGNGTITGDSGSVTDTLQSEVTSYVKGIWSNTAKFTYTRNLLTTDASTYLMFELIDAVSGTAAFAKITLYDSTGAEML